jgi:hypothetical protein
MAKGGGGAATATRVGQPKVTRVGQPKGIGARSAARAMAGKPVSFKFGNSKSKTKG